MNNKVVVFLPCRSGSQRVPKKNTRPFLSNGESLLSIKIDQLLAVELIHRIVLSTDDHIVKNIGIQKRSDRIVIDDRPTSLASSETLTDDLIKYVPKIINSEHVLWTHVTSPFINSDIYTKAIEKYFYCLGSKKNDSLMSVTEIKKFIWDKNGSLNYSRKSEKWPRTQTLEPIYEINSGIFMAHSNIYRKFSDRIGMSPFFFTLDEFTAYDIDWELDFKVGQELYKIHNNLI